MIRPEFAAVTVHGPIGALSSCPDVTVLAVAETREALAFATPLAGQMILPLAYLGGRRPPVVGERLGTWSDCGSIYALAPKR